MFKDKERIFFKAVLDSKAKYISYGIITLSIITFFVIFIINGVGSITGAIFFIWWGIIFFSYLFSPMGYTINHKSISILTRIKRFKILLSDIKEIKKLEKEALSQSVRVFGIGGLFGYTGLFYSKNLKFYLSFCTSHDRLIMIKARRVYLISPEDRDLFYKIIEKGLS